MEVSGEVSDKGEGEIWTVYDVERLYHALESKERAVERARERIKELERYIKDMEALCEAYKEALDECEGDAVVVGGVKIHKDVAVSMRFRTEVEMEGAKVAKAKLERRVEKLEREIKRIKEKLEEIRKGKLVINGEVMEINGEDKATHH